MLKPFQEPTGGYDNYLQTEHGIVLSRYSGMRTISVQKLHESWQERLLITVAEFVFLV